jgi:pimeloyl-ACP methyl ester carboxylesterase
VNVLIRVLGAPLATESDGERAAQAQLDTFRADGSGYFLEMATRPQTIGYALLDSPVALAAWMLDHDTDGYYKIAGAFVAGKPTGNLTRDNILDNILGFTTFPGEVWAAPRSWVEQSYPGLAYFNKADRGGHFAAWEEPQLLSEEVRATFRSLR